MCAFQADPTTPTPVGVLYDYPPPDGGATFERAVRLGLAAADIDPTTIDLRSRTCASHRDTDAVIEAFRDLAADGVAAIIGPAISDSAVAVAPIATELGVPCINYSGSEQSRSEFGFHYQIGSLEEEPYVLAAHLSARGARRVAVVHDRSFIGEQYHAFFADAARRVGIDLAAVVSLSPDGADAAEAAQQLDESTPVAYLGLGMSAYPLARHLSDACGVVATSALMFGYAMPEWAAAWEGWVYVDAVHDHNPVLSELKRQWPGPFPPGPTVAGAHDMGRLVGEALRRAPSVDGNGIRAGLEQVKQVPAALGTPGTVMGFGRHDRGALHGQFLVMREWRGGESRLFGRN
jgi:ABC-type branched-subunit amino acid transport system substrate-binding protein